MIGPNPTYPSHATAEAMHHGGHHLTYPLKLDDGGRIDVDDLERKVRTNEHIVGILVINPNNPLGVVHPREDLEAVVRIAREHDCFLVFDEIYQHLVFDPSKVVRLADIIGDVPGISMKGISKEHPVAREPVRLDRGLQRRARPQLPRLREHHRRSARCSRSARPRCRRSCSRRS